MPAHFSQLVGAARTICRIVAVSNRHLQGDVSGCLLLTR
jgi:hypothetical protein